MNIRKTIEENIGVIKELRNKLHLNPELSYQEYKTQKIICDFFKDLGISTESLFETGVVATLNDGDHCIAVRADMDAISVNGISHACGHDYHMAIASGVALVLKKLGIDKCVKFIFQPAEEADGGAMPMIQRGVLENPKVVGIIGFHVWPEVKVGSIEVSAGPSMASTDDFRIIFKGKGGHAAMPHLCKNPLYPAMDFIQTMNIKAKIESNPLDSHIIAFSSVQCGSATNVIADECILLGTARTFNNSLRNKIHHDILKTSDLCAEEYGCTVETRYNFHYPPLVSDDVLTNHFIEQTKKLIGDHNVLHLERTFASEDFAFFAEEVPAVHFRLGIADDDKGLHSLHSMDFDASDEAIYYGIYIITNFIKNQIGIM